MSGQTLYQQPAVLSRQKHKNLRFTPQKDASFAREVNSVPVNGVEFFEASRELPILFSKDKNDNYFPVVLLSLINKGHHLTDEKGRWKPEVYMPAFIRRYPFILSSKGAVCADIQAPHFAAKEGVPLITANGEDAALLKNAITFLRRFDKQNALTREYAKACKEAGLFKPCALKIRQGKQKMVSLDSLYVLDEAKLARLSPEQVIDWHKKGWLAWSYAQIHSLGAVQRLVRRQKEHDKAKA